MINNLLRLWGYFAMLLMMLFAAHSHADSNLQVITNVLEEIRIMDVSPIDSDSNTSFNFSKQKGKGPSVRTKSSGAIRYEHISCLNCVNGFFNYNQLTKLINPFGAKKTIEELESWKGSRAQITYRMSDNHILEIKILP